MSAIRQSSPISILALGLALAPGRASGAVSTLIITDTPSAFHVQITDVSLPLLPGTTNYGIAPAGANWLLTLTTSQFYNGGGLFNDTVSMIGTVQHIIPPHGEGPGPLFNFNFANATNLGAAGGVSIPYGPQGGTQAHGLHNDIVTCHLIVTSAGAAAVTGVGLIASWRLDIDAQHTPAPGTAALFLLGAAVVSKRRR